MIPVIDMHCDTIALIASRNVQAENQKNGKIRPKGEGFSFTLQGEELVNGISLRRNGRMIDLERLKSAGYMCQSFAMYVSRISAEEAGMEPFAYLCFISDLLDREVSANADLVRPALTGSEIEKNFREGFVSALKTVEEGLPYGGKTEHLREMYRRGVRKSTLTWNYENELAFGHRMDPSVKGGMAPDSEHGLKKAGFDFIEAMEEMGMVIDVSHLNDAGIRDVFRTVRPDTPVIASHSNARAVCGHPRNLPDEFLRLMADHGGVTGINFCHAFLGEDQIDSAEKRSRISDMIEHMRYIRNLAGIDVIGLGSDFDGISSDCEIAGCGEMQKLAEAMEAAGFTDAEIEKVFYGNALRVYKEVLG